MRGRKPKPTKIKKLEGNPGKRAINKDEPKPEPGAPPCPIWLQPEARRYWKYLVSKLLKLGVLADIDIGVMANHCTALEDLAKSRRGLAKNGHVLKSPFGDKKSPWISIGEKARDAVNKSGEQLGLTASARARLKVEPPKPKDPFEEFQKKGQRLRVVK